MTEIREIAEDNVLGPSTQSIVDAARRRGIPWFRLSQGSLVQLGHGRSRPPHPGQRNLEHPNIGVEIASDKDPHQGAPRQSRRARSPRRRLCATADDAWDVAQDLNAPVVLKPYDGNQGKAVSVNLTTEEQVRTAFDLASEHSRRVIVEQYLPGRDFRLLVVGGKLVAAAERRPAQVVADGRHNIRDPRADGERRPPPRRRSRLPPSPASRWTLWPSLPSQARLHLGKRAPSRRGGPPPR